jgi:hypothetical protein
MQNVSVLNNTIGRALIQELSIDTRKIVTFIAAVTFLIVSQKIYLSTWASWAPPQTKAGSRIRQFARWMANSSIDPHEWYNPIFRYAMRDWKHMPIFLALDTSMLYDRFCCVQISMIYMNRAIPVAWCVLEHESSSVKYEHYSQLFERVVALLPKDVEIFFLADRGFVCRKLMRRLQELKWTWRIRVKGNQKLQGTNGGFIKPKTLPLSIGKALLYSKNLNFGKGLERISLSAGWARGSKEPWYVLSADAASTEVFMDYARRFGIEEGFRDEKSGGYDIEAGNIRDAKKLERLLLVVATALIVAVSEGISITLAGKQEEVDPHQFRSLSYFQLGLRWILRCFLHGLKMFSDCLLRPMNDPIPVASTKKESRRRRKKKNPAYLFWQVEYCSL